MQKVFVDTNIVMDLLSRREEFYKPASWLFTLADNKEVILAISSLTFANTFYLLSKELDIAKVKGILRKFNPHCAKNYPSKKRSVDNPSIYQQFKWCVFV